MGRVSQTQTHNADNLRRELLQQGQRGAGVTDAYAHVFDQMLFEQAKNHRRNDATGYGSSVGQKGALVNAAQTGKQLSLHHNHNVPYKSTHSEAMSVLSKSHSALLTPNGLTSRGKGRPLDGRSALSRAGASQVVYNNSSAPRL